MIADLFGRRGDYTKPGTFVPYFQYKIGAYQSDHLLYFQKKPNGILYYNEFFNKLNEYTPGDIADFLEFHYGNYPDKEKFLSFLGAEISVRLKRKFSEDRRNKLQEAQGWVLKKQLELRPVPTAATQPLPQKSTDSPNQDEDDREERLQNLIGLLPTGDIQLNNLNHQVKLIQLLYLIQTIKAPAKYGKGEQLFNKFTNKDLASILKLHFTGFTDKEINTIEKNIRDCRDALRHEHPKLKQLETALQEFFYS